MADARRHKDDVSPAQAVAVGTHQILRTAVIAAEQQLIKNMAVEVQLGIGIAHIPVGLHKGFRHLQFLIKIFKINALCPKSFQDLLCFFLCGWWRKPF